MMASLTEWSNLDTDTIEKTELQIQEELSEVLTTSSTATCSFASTLKEWAKR